MTKFVIAIFVVCSSIDVTTAECPDAWVTFNRSCYLFSHDLKTFTDAENYCIQHGGHLGHIENEAENAFVKDFCNQLQTHNFWIGLTDTIIEGIWRWKDNDEKAVYTDFQPGEPNLGHAENCVMMHSGYAFKWADYSCNGLFMPICEKK